MSLCLHQSTCSADSHSPYIPSCCNSCRRFFVSHSLPVPIVFLILRSQYSYQSLLTIPGSSSTIELTFETKLLGYWLTADMKPSKHVSHILEIAYKRLWAISRLKSAGVKEDDILYFLNMKIRSVLEYCAPIFTSMLTAEKTYDIEDVQKIALRVILNDREL